MPRQNLLIVADSEHDANMLYAVGMFVPDPFIYLSLKGKNFAVLSDLEIDRARRQARNCRVLSLSRCLRELQREGVDSPRLPEVIGHLLRQARVKKIPVPENFPHGLALQLRRLKVKVKIQKDSVFPGREIKSADEVKKISAALMMAEVGLAEGMQALKSSKIARDGRLVYRDAPMTSERLRAVIDVAVLKAGGVANHTIVAGGRQACDPHEPGYGALRANHPIIIDIFPRSQKTGYYGDITRTVVKGRASEAVRQLYEAVARSQAMAFAQMRDRTPVKRIHQTVQDYFASQGYKTCRRKSRMEGFFHGTGHGLGLEIHEAPRVNPNSDEILRAGHVVTVEPGLYYPSIGGVRLEDVVLVSSNGPRNLTKFEKVLEI